MKQTKVFSYLHLQVDLILQEHNPRSYSNQMVVTESITTDRTNIIIGMGTKNIFTFKGAVYVFVAKSGFAITFKIEGEVAS